MKRGQVWWVSWTPLAETPRRQRRAVIISTDAANRHLNRVHVIPLTRSLDYVFPSEALVDLNGRQYVAHAHLLMTMPKVRMRRQIGRLLNRTSAKSNARFAFTWI